MDHISDRVYRGTASRWDKPHARYSRTVSQSPTLPASFTSGFEADYLPPLPYNIEAYAPPSLSRMSNPNRADHGHPEVMLSRHHYPRRRHDYDPRVQLEFPGRETFSPSRYHRTIYDLTEPEDTASYAMRHRVQGATSSSVYSEPQSMRPLTIPPVAPPRRRGHESLTLLKWLVPVHLAGAVIGKGGRRINKIMEKSGVLLMRFSKAGQVFPTTTHRMTLLQGTPTEICRAIRETFAHLREQQLNDTATSGATNSSTEFLTDSMRDLGLSDFQFAIKDQATGVLIGKKGCVIREISELTSVAVSVSPKVKPSGRTVERVVTMRAQYVSKLIQALHIVLTTLYEAYELDDAVSSSDLSSSWQTCIAAQCNLANLSTRHLSTLFDPVVHLGCEYDEESPPSTPHNATSSQLADVQTHFEKDATPSSNDQEGESSQEGEDSGEGESTPPTDTAQSSNVRTSDGGSSDEVRPSDGVRTSDAGSSEASSGSNTSRSPSFNPILLHNIQRVASLVMMNNKSLFSSELLSNDKKTASTKTTEESGMERTASKEANGDFKSDNDKSGDGSETPSVPTCGDAESMDRDPQNHHTRTVNGTTSSANGTKDSSSSGSSGSTGTSDRGLSEMSFDQDVGGRSTRKLKAQTQSTKSYNSLSSVNLANYGSSSDPTLDVLAEAMYISTKAATATLGMPSFPWDGRSGCATELNMKLDDALVDILIKQSGKCLRDIERVSRAEIRVKPVKSDDEAMRTRRDLEISGTIFACHMAVLFISMKVHEIENGQNYKLRTSTNGPSDDQTTESS